MKRKFTLAAFLVLWVCGLVLGHAVPEGQAGHGININTATVKELQSLEGIGKVLAQRIVVYRETQPFKAKEDLLKVEGLGKAKLAKILDHITVEDQMKR